MKEIILDALIDCIKIFPFLFLAFLLIEYVEHKLDNKKLVSTSGVKGPLVGSLLGLLPQCGFGTLATNLYITRIISLGTLIAIYLATSDEMLPILISQKVSAKLIISILVIKFLTGLIIGFIIDFILRKRKKNDKVNYHICEEEHCHCNEGILKSSLIHSIKIFFFLLIITFILNIIMHYVGIDFLSKILLKDSIFSPFISSLIGLIPNCAASIVITELYLSSAINFGTMIGGLLTGSGVSLIILFKSNKNIKENLLILGILYFIGAIMGIAINIVCAII